MLTARQIHEKSGIALRTIQWRIFTLKLVPVEVIGNAPRFNADQVRAVTKRTRGRPRKNGCPRDQGRAA